MKFLVVLIAILTIGCSAPSSDQANNFSESREESIETVKEIERTIIGNYAAMESEDVSKILDSYHAETNLPSSREQLEKYFEVAGMAYKISDIRYIGNDGTNYVVIFHEVTEFRKKTNKEDFTVVDNEDTDVLMVFRKQDGKFKIFTSRSLKPGMW